MGNSQSFADGEDEPVATNPLPLTKAQIHLIRRLWNQARRKGAHEPGRAILGAIFSRDPKIREIFSFNSGVDESFKFNLHADRFTATLDNVVRNLHNLNAIIPDLQQLGKQHVKLAKERGFDPKFWDVFAQAMVERSLGWSARSLQADTQQTWTKVILFVIDRMRDGYYIEMKQNRKFSSDANSGRKFSSPSDSDRKTSGDPNADRKTSSPSDANSDRKTSSDTNAASDNKNH